MWGESGKVKSHKNLVLAPLHLQSECVQSTWAVQAGTDTMTHCRGPFDLLPQRRRNCELPCNYFPTTSNACFGFCIEHKFLKGRNVPWMPPSLAAEPWSAREVGGVSHSLTEWLNVLEEKSWKKKMVVLRSRYSSRCPLTSCPDTSCSCEACPWNKSLPDQWLT